MPRIVLLVLRRRQFIQYGLDQLLLQNCNQQTILNQHLELSYVYVNSRTLQSRQDSLSHLVMMHELTTSWNSCFYKVFMMLSNTSGKSESWLRVGDELADIGNVVINLCGLNPTQTSVNVQLVRSDANSTFIMVKYPVWNGQLNLKRIIG